ncbi:MAG TPA: hypothetical protein VMG09_16220 [Bacteroidota bacterium]|nr:hypothetical protein [Bacteroidota bacterium]
MKIDARLPIQVGCTLAGAAALGGYPLLRYGSGDVVAGVVLGTALSTLNILLGYIAIEYSFEKSYTVFVRTVIGGMGIRLVLMLGLLALLIGVFHVHALALAFSLLGFYLVFLLLEVLFIQRKVTVKNANTPGGQTA